MEKVTALQDLELKLQRVKPARCFGSLDWLEDAVTKNVITDDEASLLREAERLTEKVIAVDDFDPVEFESNYATTN